MDLIAHRRHLVRCILELSGEVPDGVRFEGYLHSLQTHFLEGKWAALKAELVRGRGVPSKSLPEMLKKKISAPPLPNPLPHCSSGGEGGKTGKKEVLAHGHNLGAPAGAPYHKGMAA